MTTTVAVLGAGGKMGFRVTRKLRDAGYDLRAVEIGEAGRERLRDAGIEAVDRAAACRARRSSFWPFPTRPSAPSRTRSSPR